MLVSCPESNPLATTFREGSTCIINLCCSCRSGNKTNIMVYTYTTLPITCIPSYQRKLKGQELVYKTKSSWVVSLHKTFRPLCIRLSARSNTLILIIKSDSLLSSIEVYNYYITRVFSYEPTPFSCSTLHENLQTKDTYKETSYEVILPLYLLVMPLFANYYKAIN